MTIYPLGYTNKTVSVEVNTRCDNRTVQAWITFNGQTFSSSRMPESFKGAAIRECFDRVKKHYKKAQFVL